MMHGYTHKYKPWLHTPLSAVLGRHDDDPMEQSQMRDLSASSTSIAGRREPSTAVFGAVDDDDGGGDVLLQLLGPIKTPQHE